MRVFFQMVQWRTVSTLVCILVSSGGIQIHSTELEGGERPNILFILTDDQRWDAVGYAGNENIKTPNIDRLAAQGVVFNQAFVTSSICAASRASIFTGLHERSHGYNFYRPPMISQIMENSYPVLLKQLGYKTGFVGKFGVKVEEGFEDKMFDYFMPFEPWGPYPYRQKMPDGSLRHLTDLTGDKVVEFLRDQNGKQPWCMSVSFNAPHSRDNDPKQYFWPDTEETLYEDINFPIPETMDDYYFNQNPNFVKISENRVRFHWRFDEPEKYQEMLRGYYRMISGVDRVVGRILKVVKEIGQSENTVVIFMSDNGYFLGERGLADKWYLYNPSVRVPLIVFDPKMKNKDREGTIVSHIALNIDIPSTIIDYAGSNPSMFPAQGASLKSLVEGRAPLDWRSEFYYEHLFHHEKVKIPRSEGVRDERWTYIRWIDSKPLVEELYDHRVDVNEVNNLVNLNSHASVLKQLQLKADQYRDKYIRESLVDSSIFKHD